MGGPEQGRTPGKVRETRAHVLECVRECSVVRANTSPFASEFCLNLRHVQEEGTGEVSVKTERGARATKRGMSTPLSRDSYSNRFSLYKQRPAALALSTLF